MVQLHLQPIVIIILLTDNKRNMSFEKDVCSFEGRCLLFWMIKVNANCDVYVSVEWLGVLI